MKAKYRLRQRQGLASARRGLNRYTVSGLAALLGAVVHMSAFAAPQNIEPVNETIPDAEQQNGRFANAFAKGLVAYEDRDFVRAHDIWLPLATQGDLAAMRNLAHLYRRGQGVPMDFEEAAKWYSRAAERGLTGAQVNLAALFHDGLGVAQSYKLAAQWYARAARAGHAHAQYRLARMIEDGHASPGNTDLAKKLYGWAVDAGHSGALERYRQLDARSTAVALQTQYARDETDVVLESSQSLKVIAGAGDAPDEDRFIFRNGDRAPLMRAHEDFKDGERSAAVGVWRDLALKSSAEAQFRFALALLEGHGISKDRKAALTWLDIAATAGHDDAASLLDYLRASGPARSVRHNEPGGE